MQKPRPNKKNVTQTGKDGSVKVMPIRLSELKRPLKTVRRRFRDK